jgi:hypothetical protein
MGGGDDESHCILVRVPKDYVGVFDDVANVIIGMAHSTIDSVFVFLQLDCDVNAIADLINLSPSTSTTLKVCLFMTLHIMSI